MDNVTHTLVGVAMANAFFRRRFEKAAVPVLALASNLPDLDGVVMLTGAPGAIALRRTFGHSLFLVPIWSVVLALVLRRFYPRHSFRALFGLTLLGAAVHLFFDLVNSFGVVLLWLFSDWRPELAIIFIVDLVLTGLLAAPLLLAAVPPLGRRLRPRFAQVSRLGLACVAAYILFCSAGRALAQRTLAGEEARLEVARATTPAAAPADFSYVFPEPLGPHRWRGVLRHGAVYSLYLIRPFSGRIVPRGEVRTDDSEPRVVRARATPLGRRLDGLFKAPVWTVGQSFPAGEAVVRAEDLRFHSLVLHGPPVLVFNFPVEEGAVKVPRSGHLP